MPQHNEMGDTEQDEMTLEEVEELRAKTEAEPTSYPGGDQDDEMADDVDTTEWEEEWRPSDEAHEQNPPTD